MDVVKFVLSVLETDRGRRVGYVIFDERHKARMEMVIRAAGMDPVKLDSGRSDMIPTDLIAVCCCTYVSTVRIHMPLDQTAKMNQLSSVFPGRVFLVALRIVGDNSTLKPLASDKITRDKIEYPIVDCIYTVSDEDVIRQEGVESLKNIVLNLKK